MKIQKGLEISRRFFLEWGLSYLKAQFPHIVDRIAAGRVGGSDIIGADDEWSRDHDWGPCFSLYLNEKDYRQHGSALRKAINAAAPERFLGHRHHFFGKPKDCVEVEPIDDTAGYHMGRAYPPKSPRDWFIRRSRRPAMVERESWAYFFVHGPVWHDPLGELTARKEMFAHYPRDVRLRLIADLCLKISGGEYKFCTRHVHRQDPVAIQICLGEFVRDAMRLCFLLNDDYAPHKVWIHHEFHKLPEAEGLDPKISRLVVSGDLQEQRDLVYNICGHLRQLMLRCGLVDSSEPAYGLRCRDVEARIEDEWIRTISII